MYDVWSEKLDRGGVLYEYTKDNYRVLEIDDSKRMCAIFCSSNSIWYPNTREAYEESIEKKDRYEWTNFQPSQFGKIIYLRDIYKSWYVTGLNSEIDCIDKLVDFIREETRGYKIACIGSSAGGYLAILLGCVLNAEYVIAFSAQMELDNKWAIEANPFLQYYKNDNSRSIYYDLAPMIEKVNMPIYYIVPMKSEQDSYHYNNVCKYDNVKVFCFNSGHHGIVMLKNNLQKLFSLSCDELDVLYESYRGKAINVLEFSIHMVGLVNTVVGLFTEIKKKIKNRLKAR